MTGYTRTWSCLICKAKIVSCDTPSVSVCEKCAEALAGVLCSESLKLALSTPGVDRSYWMDMARRYAGVLFLRWKAKA